MNLNFLISSLIVGLTPLSVVFSAPNGETNRTLEISAKDVPLFGSVQFLNQNGAPIGFNKNINGERFDWISVPDEATQFKVNTVSASSPALDLEKNTNTFVTVNAASIGGNPDQGLVQQIKSVPRVLPGKEGWVFIGSLANREQWKSLYILDPQTLQSPDSHHYFSYESLQQLLNQGTHPTYVADFPLYLRASLDSSRPTADPIVRAGQKFEIKAVRNVNEMVYAFVKVL